MAQNKKRPVIGIVSCAKEVRNYSVQSVNHFYIKAVRDFGGVPLLIPAGGERTDIEYWLTIFDGILLPGSYSNVAPHHYGADHHEPCVDEGRDALSLALIRQCVADDIPILGICRGFQEMNVALGGDLYQNVHALEGYLDHREIDVDDFGIKYAPVHAVTLCEGGQFQQWLNGQQDLQVNSLHWQGVKTLAKGLTVEAIAPDGLVEGFSIHDHRFFVGVQWHPEWLATENPFSVQLFRHFLKACHV